MDLPRPPDGKQLNYHQLYVIGPSKIITGLICRNRIAEHNRQTGPVRRTEWARIRTYDKKQAT